MVCKRFTSARKSSHALPTKPKDIFDIAAPLMVAGLIRSGCEARALFRVIGKTAASSLDKREMAVVNDLGELLDAWGEHEREDLANNDAFWREIDRLCREVRRAIAGSRRNDFEFGKADLLLGAIATAASTRRSK